SRGGTSGNGSTATCCQVTTQRWCNLCIRYRIVRRDRNARDILEGTAHAERTGQWISPEELHLRLGAERRDNTTVEKLLRRVGDKATIGNCATSIQATGNLSTGTKASFDGKSKEIGDLRLAPVL